MEQRLGEEIISCGQHNRDPDTKPLIPEFRQDDGLQDIIDGLQEADCAVIHNFQCETDIEQLKAQLAPFALVLIYSLPVWQTYAPDLFSDPDLDNFLMLRIVILSLAIGMLLAIFISGTRRED
ncbi:MAG: hypothetical protein ACI9CE_001864 [Flavobacterium sp.]|jgi:hypothetical protein